MELPDSSTVKGLLDRYAPVRLKLDRFEVTERDRLALRKLIEAASWIDRIFWKQHSEEGVILKESLSNRKEAQDLVRLLNINFGPWDNFDNDRPFVGNVKPRPRLEETSTLVT